MKVWIALACLGLAALAVAIDGFVLLLGLPRISADLRLTSTQQLWVTDIYSFMLAGFPVIMGRVGDRTGRRRTLLTAAAAFAAASILAAVAPTGQTLIVARAVMGIAGAALAPSTLALLSMLFPDQRRRSLAIGVWLTCTMAGGVIGPLVGGLVLAIASWRVLFLLCVPVMILLLVLAPVVVPRDAGSGGGRIDVLSATLALAAVMPAVYGIKEVARGGLGLLPIAAVVIGGGFGFAYVRHQRRLVEPLLDLSLFSIGRFRAALLGMMLVSGTGVLMVYAPQYFQLVAGLSPLHSALSTLPAVTASIAGMLASPLAARRVRPSALISGGVAVSLTGLGVMALSMSHRDTAGVIAGYALWNAGCSPMVALGVELIVGAVPSEDVGAAGALSETSGQLGYALGIGVIGSIAAAIYRSRLGTQVVAASLAHSPQVLIAGIDGVIAGVASLLVGIGLLALIALREVPAYARHVEPAPHEVSLGA